MRAAKLLCLIIFLHCYFNNFSQTVDSPVLISLHTSSKPVSLNQEGYVLVEFNVPDGIWLGAQQGESRTPPATKIIPKETSGFKFKDPLYPDPLEEWVPAKLGRTKVFKETFNVIVPFTVDQSVSVGTHTLTLYITYTPGYSAGALSTHVNEAYSIPINVGDNNVEINIPSPKLMANETKIVVQPKSYEEIPGLFKFMFKPLNEESAFVKGIHKIWGDKPGHGKSVRFMPFPSASSTNITSSSVGMGLTLFNSTREGTMTGNLSMGVWNNDLIGAGLSLGAISCPGAYHNYQFSASLGGESYRDINFKYENFTYANSNLGVDFRIRSLNEPRWRFYGIGNETVVENETVFRKEDFNVGLDLYSLSVMNFRFGIGVSYDNFGVGESFDDIRTLEGIEFLQDSDLSTGLLGINGGNQLSFKVNVIYDHKNQEFTPSKGFFAKLSLSYNSVSGTDNTLIVDDYYGLDLDLRQYFSGPSQKLIVLMRGGLQLKSEENLPFFTLSSLGGPNSTRAYDFERFLGQNAAFVSTEMRYSLFSLKVLGYPMVFEMGAFLDVGQVYGNSELDVDSSLKVDPGISMRMINKPNIGLILNFALGDDGGYFTGGIGLPF